MKIADINQECKPEKLIPLADFQKAHEIIMAYVPPPKYKYFFTGGTGIPDEYAIDYFKGISNIVVVDRKRNMWRQGKPHEGKLFE